MASQIYGLPCLSKL